MENIQAGCRFFINPGKKTKSYQKAAKKTEECSTVIDFFKLFFF